VQGDVTIRREEPRDADAVRRVNEFAFGQPIEANIVRELRAAGASTLSLVAEKDGCVVGHILFSTVTMDSPAGQLTGIGLAPMAVLPDQQRKGIGTLLVQEGLAELRRLGHDVVVVLGHPDYYPRFGFKRASQFGLRTEIDCPDEAFMAIELRRGALAGRSGMVRYRPEFGAV
jgi:putative acetyltransferase